MRCFWYILKGLFKGFQWPFRSLKLVKYSQSYGPNEVCDILYLLEPLSTYYPAVPFSLWDTPLLLNLTIVSSFLFYILGTGSHFFLILVLFLLLYSFFYTLCTASLSFLPFLLLPLSSSMFGHSYLQCPTPQYLKHFTSFTLFCCFIFTSSFILHCITLVTNISYLFWGFSLFTFSLLWVGSKEGKYLLYIHQLDRKPLEI